MRQRTGRKHPKNICDRLGISVGDVLNVTIFNGGVTLTPTKAHKGRNRVTAEQLFDGWDAPYDPPTDFPSVDNEVDRGSPVGNEVW